MSRRHFIIAAAGFHLLLAISVYLIGYFSIFPEAVSPAGIIADDAYVYRKQAISLVEILTQQGIAAWLNAPFQFHVKLYSLSFAIFGPVLGFNNLSIEPLNLSCYLAILYLVFKLGQEVFNRQTAFLATTVVALWPSFALLTTQLLRDPLFILVMLALMLVMARLLIKGYSWRRGLLTGAAGGIIGLLLWIIRIAMWEVVVSLVLLGVALFLGRLLRERRVLVGNLAGVALMLGMIISVPYVARTFGKPVVMKKPSAMAETPLSSPLARMRFLRRRFNKVNEDIATSSNIDTNVEFATLADIVGYLPRAAIIGYFAPFPNMWLAPVDPAGRLRRWLAGLETICMYVVEVLALVGLWSCRRRFPAWLLFLATAIGVIALGMVVANIGTLYRLRYAFWMLLILLGMEGARLLPSYLEKLKKKTTTPVSSGDVSYPEEFI
jgi:putative peptidoglycan lipid II flippase